MQRAWAPADRGQVSVLADPEVWACRPQRLASVPVAPELAWGRAARARLAWVLEAQVQRVSAVQAAQAPPVLVRAAQAQRVSAVRVLPV